MLNSEFAKLIVNSHLLEDDFIEILKQPGDIVHIPVRDEAFSEYDFCINDIKYECKLDSNLTRHNTMFCEYLSRNIPSGISITKSDYYCIKSEDNYYIIPVQYIKDLIKTNEFRTKHCGYKSYSSCYLIPSYHFIQFKLINEIDF